MTSTFAYNPAGQIASKTQSNDAAYTWVPPNPNSTISAQFDGRNRLTQFGGAAVASDANGNVSAGVNNLAYSYDVLGQLRGATGGPSGVSVDYDPSGMLRRITNGSTVTEYLYDGGNLVAEYVGGTLAKRYVHGPGNDEPLVAYDGAGLTNLTYLYADERSSVVTAANSSGVASTSAVFGSYGESTALVAPFGYTGQRYLPELQLYYYKARMYSPATGRFVQPDPTGYADGMNLYGYVGGDPINSVDPSGLDGELREVPVNGAPWDWGSICPQGRMYCTAISLGDYQWIYPSAAQNIAALAQLSGAQASALLSRQFAPQSEKPCDVASPPPSKKSVSSGFLVTGSSINPFTSRGGTTVGANAQSVPFMTKQEQILGPNPLPSYTTKSEGVGFNVGISAQSVWARGSGTWTGTSKSINVSLLIFSGSIFWTPGDDGWDGFSFGLGLGLPGVSYETVTTTCMFNK